jgi:hypothetical protein
VDERDEFGVVLTHQIFDIFADMLRPEERRDAFDEISRRVAAGLECFELIRGRRVPPPSNN